MRTLLIDLGNTALKWALLGEELSPRTVVHRGRTGFKEELYAEWLKLQPDCVLGCTVAAPELAFSVTKFFNEHGIRWNWVRSQPSFESRDFVLLNSYDRPAQLGADRWCAALGAVDAVPENSLVVVQMGTATTVDAVLREDDGRHVFLGGRIAPGPTLIKQCLEEGIPSLKGQLGEWKSFPANTRDAITTGILDAQAGLVRSAWEELAERSTTAVRVILAGGAAGFVEKRIAEVIPSVTRRHNLVLLGLAAQARHRTECRALRWSEK